MKNPSRFKLPRSAIPTDLLARVRLLLLSLVLLFSLLAVPSLALPGEQPWPARLLAFGSLVWLAWRWIDWYRSERRLPIELAIETLAITLVTGSVQTLPDALPVVYTGLFYRSLFSSVRQAYLGLLCYSLAFTAGAMVVRPEPGLFAREVVIQFPGFAVVTAVAYHVAEMLRHQRRLAAELEAAELRYRMLVEHAPVVTYLAEAGGAISYINPRVTTLLGYAPAELRALGVAACVFDVGRAAGSGPALDRDHPRRSAAIVAAWQPPAPTVARPPTWSASQAAGSVAIGMTANVSMYTLITRP